jgi:hypothetical protein
MPVNTGEKNQISAHCYEIQALELFITEKAGAVEYTFFI